MAPDAVPDRDLIERFTQTGDRPSFEALVLRHLPLVRRVLLVALRGDQEAAQDAEQEVLIKLYHGLGSFRFGSQFSTYLFSLCRRTAFEAMRKQGREGRRLDRAFTHDLLPHLEGRQQDQDPAAILTRSEHRERILEALYRLDEPDRSLVYLKEAEDWEVRDLATGFGLAEGTVKSKLSRARAKLRVLLEGGEG